MHPHTICQLQYDVNTHLFNWTFSLFMLQLICWQLWKSLLMSSNFRFKLKESDAMSKYIYSTPLSRDLTCLYFTWVFSFVMPRPQWQPWPEALHLRVFHPSVPFLLTENVQNTLSEFLQICKKCPFGLKDELIRFGRFLYAWLNLLANTQ